MGCRGGAGAGGHLCCGLGVLVVPSHVVTTKVKVKDFP